MKAFLRIIFRPLLQWLYPQEFAAVKLREAMKPWVTIQERKWTELRGEKYEIMPQPSEAYDEHGNFKPGWMPRVGRIKNK